jgi:hypothetical protein
MMANNLGQRTTGPIQAKPLMVPNQQETPQNIAPALPWHPAPVNTHVPPHGPNSARGQMLGGLTPGGYTIQQLQADPSLAGKLGAHGAEVWNQYQQRNPAPAVAVPHGVQAPPRAVTPANPEVFIANEPQQNPQGAAPPQQPGPVAADERG